METMKLLVRIVIAFMWIMVVNCKVIKQPTKLSDTIDVVSPKWDDGGPDKWHLNVNFTDASISKTNTSTTNINSLTTSHMPFTDRSFGKIKKIKKSLKKLFLASAYYAPEFGLCSCLFKFAWITYPIVPEVTYAALGRAQRMVGSFMQDFVYGFQDSYSSQSYNEYEYQYDHDRISNKVAQTTADDYNDYQSRFTSNRRISERIENPPLVHKIDPKVARVVEMLKNLKPKANQNDSFVIRYARALNTLGIDQKSSPAVILMEIAKYLQTYRDSVKSIQPLNDTRNFEGRSLLASNVPYVNSNTRRVYAERPPSGLPSYQDLPPADYHYFKDGMYHHVHDLRQNKRPPRGERGGWLSFDFSETIMSALGLLPPGRTIKPTASACGKAYIFNAMLRLIQTTFL